MRSRIGFVCAHLSEQRPGMDDAKAWIEANSTDRPPVFATGEIPPSVLRTLQRSNLVINVPGGIAIIRSPGDNRSRA
jgi:hypothetical protein